MLSICTILCGQSTSIEAKREKHVSEEHFARKERKQSLRKAFETKNYCQFAFHMICVRRQHKKKKRHAHEIEKIDNKHQSTQGQPSSSNG